MSSRQNIPVLNRTLQVLEALTLRGKASAKELSMDLEIPSATCYRILNTLADANWLLHDTDGDYRLSFGISRLGGLAADMARFFAVSHQPMADVTEHLTCSVKISVREGDDWLILARQECAASGITLQQVGIRDRVVVGSAGAVLLRDESEKEVRRIAANCTTDQLPHILQRIHQCQERGFALNPGQTNPRIHAVSVPLSLLPLEKNAALSAVFSPEKTPSAGLDSVVTALRECSERIEKALALR